MPSSSIALARARIPSPEVFSERKSSSMMMIGKWNRILQFSSVAPDVPPDGRIIQKGGMLLPASLRVRYQG